MTPLILLGLLTCPVAAEGPGLGAGVPSDVALYVRWQTAASGAARDLGVRLRGSIRGSELFREVAGTVVEKTVLGLLEKVDWLDLLSTEAVLAIRAEDHTPEALLLFRLARGRAAETAEGLRRIAYAICSTGPELEIVEDWRSEDRTLVLTGASPEVAPSFAVRGDVLVASTSPFLLRRSLQLLAGEGSDLGYALTGARAEAVSGLPLPPPTADARLEIHAGASVSMVAWMAGGEIRYAYRLRVAESAADPPGVEGLWSAVPAGTDRFEVSAGLRPETVLPTLGAIRDPLGAGLDRLRRAGLLGGAWVRRTLDAVDFVAEASPLLSGRRVVLSSADGACALLELGRGESTASRMADLLERVGKSVGARDVEAGPGGLRWLEVPSWGLGAARGETRKVLAGVAGGRLVLATSGDLAARALAGTGAERRGSPRELVGDWVGDVAGRIESVRILERPRALSALRGAAGILSALGSGRDGVVGALPRLEAILQALGPLGEERSAAVRDGATVRGFGTIRVEGAAGPVERRL